MATVHVPLASVTINDLESNDENECQNPASGVLNDGVWLGFCQHLSVTSAVTVHGKPSFCLEGIIKRTFVKDARGQSQRSWGKPRCYSFDSDDDKTRACKRKWGFGCLKLLVNFARCGRVGTNILYACGREYTRALNLHSVTRYTFENIERTAPRRQSVVAVHLVVTSLVCTMRSVTYTCARNIILSSLNVRRCFSQQNWWLWLVTPDN